MKYRKYGGGGKVQKVVEQQQEINDFYTNYLNSPNYRKRLIGEGYKDPDKTITDRLGYLNSLNYSNINGKGNEYISSSNTINTDSKEINKYKFNPIDVKTHEVSHGIGSLGYSSIIDDSNSNRVLRNKEIDLLNANQNPNIDLHDKIAGERKADLDVLRFNLKKDGIYDTGTQEFNQDLLNKAKNKYKNNPVINRNFKSYQDQDLINLMNKVAVNTPSQNLDTTNPIQMAKYGGYIEYDGGGVTPNFQSQVNGYASDAKFASDILQSIAPDSNIGDYGGGALSGAASGAQMGAAFGPEGAVIGGAVGLVGGVFGAYKKKQAEMNARKQQQMNLSIANRQRQDTSDKAILSGYNTNGNSTVTGYYAYGGYLKVLKPVKFLKSPLKKMPDGGIVGDPKRKISLAPVMIDSTTGLPIANNGQVDLGYSRVYGSQNNIPNNNIEALKAQYRSDSSVMNILNRNIAPQGQVPMYGADDGDAIRRLLGVYQAPQQVAANVVPHLGEGGSIHIKPSHKGRFTAYKARTGKTTSEALHSNNEHIREMAQFATNAKHFKHADGGELPPSPTLTGQGSTTQLASDTHQFNGPSHADGGIPIDTTGNGQPNAEVEGNEVQKGNQIYSDRLTISPMLDLQLKMAKVQLSGKPTYAEVATKLGKLKGKFEGKLGSYSPVINRTGKKMVDKYDELLEQTFADQEQSKQMMQPQMAFGGRLPMYAGGGTIDPRDGYQQKIDAINKQIAASDAKYEQLKSQGKQTYALEQMNRYRQQVKQRLQQSLGNYKSSIDNYGELAKNYNPDNTFTNFLSKIHVIGGNMDSAKFEIGKHDKAISDYSEILNRLDPSKVDASKGDWRKQVDVPWSIDDPFDSNVKSTATTTPRVNTPIVSKTPIPAVNTAAPTTLIPPSHTSSPVTKSGNGRYKAIRYNSHLAPLAGISTNAIQPEAMNSTLPNITVGNTAVSNAPANATLASGDSPGFMSRVGDAINDYGADALNAASYIGNASRIGAMKAPTFSYNLAPTYNYTDRSGLAKNENAVATRNMMKSVVNTSAQGQQAQKAGIFAQNLESNNQINNNENQRYDAYNNNYDNRVLQIGMGNTDIANKQADVTTQVGNDKIALNIQNQNAFNQGEVQNQATRAQQSLDNTKTGFILAASQDPSKLVQLLSSTTDPVLRRKIQLMMRGTN